MITRQDNYILDSEIYICSQLSLAPFSEIDKLDAIAPIKAET